MPSVPAIQKGNRRWRVPVDLRILLRTTGGVGQSVKTARSRDAGSDSTSKGRTGARVGAQKGQGTVARERLGMKRRFACWLLMAVFAAVSALSLLGALKLAELMGWA